MREDQVADGGEAHLGLVPPQLFFECPGILEEIEDARIQDLAVERSVPSEDRFKSSGLRGAVERSTVGCRRDRYEPVSARLKGFAEDSQDKTFSIHALKLTPEPSIASDKIHRRYSAARDASLLRSAKRLRSLYERLDGVFAAVLGVLIAGQFSAPLPSEARERQREL